MKKEEILARLNRLEYDLDYDYGRGRPRGEVPLLTLESYDKTVKKFSLLTPEVYEKIKSKFVKEPEIDCQTESEADQIIKSCLDNLEVKVKVVYFENECLKREIQILKGYISHMEEEIGSYKERIRNQRYGIRRKEEIIKTLKNKRSKR